MTGLWQLSYDRTNLYFQKGEGWVITPQNLARTQNGQLWSLELRRPKIGEVFLYSSGRLITVEDWQNFVENQHRYLGNKYEESVYIPGDAIVCVFTPVNS